MTLTLSRLMQFRPYGAFKRMHNFNNRLRSSATKLFVTDQCSFHKTIHARVSTVCRLIWRALRAKLRVVQNCPLLLRYLAEQPVSEGNLYHLPQAADYTIYLYLLCSSKSGAANK